jgi:PEGA domain
VGVVVAAAIGIAVVASGGKKSNDPVATGSGSAEIVATKQPEPQPQPQPQPQPPQPQPQPTLGSAGVAVVAPPPPDAGVKPIEATVAKTVSIELTSTPDGAEIYLNSVDTGKHAPDTLTLPAGGKPAQITFKLHGYADVVLANVALDGGDLKKDVTLKKVVAQTQTTTTQQQTQQTHQTQQTQKPHTTAKPCDTCLEPP